MLRVRPCDLAEANAYVAKLHRHHKPVVGHKFSLMAKENDDRMCGVAIVGRPVARGCNHRTTMEVTRLCTDGTKNACSTLYAASARTVREMGYKKIQTYLLESELGTSLLAAGWTKEAITSGGQWTGTDGKPRRTDQPTCKKSRWAKVFEPDNYPPPPEDCDDCGADGIRLLCLCKVLNEVR